MTPEEFNVWRKQMFVQYPNVHEWLQDKSPDPPATMRHWCAVLERYTFDECMAVLDEWARIGNEPFKAYEREQIPFLVRSTAQRTRDREAKKQQLAIERHYRNAGRGESLADNLAEQFNRLGLKEAILELVPKHKQFLDGELSKEEYQRKLEAVQEQL